MGLCWICHRRIKRNVTDLDDSLHHAHHLVDDGDDFVRSLRWRHVGPVRRRQDVAAGHIQDISRWEFEVNCGAVGVVDNGWQEGVFSWKETVCQKIRPQMLMVQCSLKFNGNTVSITATKIKRHSILSANTKDSVYLSCTDLSKNNLVSKMQKKWRKNSSFRQT